MKSRINHLRANTSWHVEPKCADDSFKDINKESENKGPSSASSRRLPVSAKAEHFAFKRVKSDLVVELVKDNWKSLVRHVNNTNLVKIMGNSDVL